MTTNVMIRGTSAAQFVSRTVAELIGKWSGDHGARFSRRLARQWSETTSQPQPA